jgi:hypothetical protein
MVTFDYVEKRYWKLEDSKEYSDLVKTLTTVRSSNASLIPQALIDKFSMTKFNEAVLTTSNKLDVPESVYAPLGGGFNHESFFQTLLTRNTSLTAYYNSVDAIDDDGSTELIAYVKGAAKLVIQFYTISSILYASMYKGSPRNKPGYLDNLVIPARSPTNTVDTISTVGQYQTLYSDDTASGTVKSYRLTKLVRAIYQIESAMNTQNETMLATVNTNIELNNDFENNDLIIRDKEDVFNKEKSYVITMMSKDKRITKQYNRKSWMFFIYLVLSLLYIFSMASLYYAGISNAVSTLNQNLVGNIMVGLNASVLLGVIVYYVLRYLFKNKFFF